MSRYRKTYKTQKDRHSMGIQSEPVKEETPEPETLAAAVKSAVLPTSTPSPSATPPSIIPLVNQQKVNNLLSNLDKIEAQTKLLNQVLKSKPKQKRKINLNMMKLQDKQFKMDNNIYNIAVGQIFSKEVYLTTLNTKIEEFKGRIKELESEDQKHFNKTARLQPVDTLPDRSRTIEARKSQCGRIYSRGSTPSSEHHKQPHFKITSKEAGRSSYYKWRPDIDESNAQVGKLVSNRYTEHSIISQQNQSEKAEKDKDYINYRVKQRSARPSVSSKQQALSTGQKSIQLESREKMNGNYLLSPDPEVYSAEPKIKNLREKSANQRSMSHRSEKTQNQEEEEPYSGILFRQPAEFEIKDINDDFRSKVVQQLQIPESFPIDSPELGLTIEEVEELGSKIFAIFGVIIRREPNKLVSRKFKNGVYFKVAQNKTILWYYSGSFYLGGWDTDLPTEGQKNGFGFEYIPDKYSYLGYFKNGLKHGKGTIKILASNPNTPEQFTVYEGEWENGKPHGFGKHMDEKNIKYIGDFNNGEKTGRATILTEEGQFYEGEVVKGIKQGKGLEKLVNGDGYEGEFQNGNFNGKGVYSWRNGSVYDGEFVKGRRQGRGLWKSTTQDTFQGDYFNDLKNGWGKFTWTNGQIYQGQFRDDIRHGEGDYRHPNGKLGRFMWKEGQIEYRIYSRQEQAYRGRNLEEDESESMENPSSSYQILAE